MKKKFWGILLTMFFSLIFLFIFYKPVLLSPNSYMFCTSGDGIKNYYTYAYHIVYDTSYVHFQGMNYPYGELHVFTDGNPALSNSLKVIYQLFPGIKEYLIGIYNLWLLLGFVITAGFLYLIIYYFTGNIWWSVLGGTAVMILSPQWIRIDGHFALAMALVLPASWYFLLRKLENNNFVYTFCIFLVQLTALFTHPYLSIISAMFLSFILLFETRKRKNIYQNLQTWLIGVLLPIIIYLTYIKFFDTHPNRPSVPWGFFQYKATFDSIFLVKSPLNFISYFFPPKNVASWEGVVYVGIIGILFIITLPLVLLKKYRNLLPKHLWIALIAASITLAYSMTFPFNLFPPETLKKIPFIAQFRSVGRFAWAFYYVIGISAFVFFYNLSRKLPIKLSQIIPVIFFSAYFIESLYTHNSLSKAITNSPNYFQVLPEELSDIKKINPKNYQAVLPLPFFHIGAKLSRPPQKDINKLSFITSFHTGLPMFAIESSRISFDETYKLLQMLSSPKYPKKIAEDMQCKKTILILSKGKEFYNEFEEYYYNQANSLAKNLKKLDCNILIKQDTSFKESPKDTVLFLTFDEKETPIKFQGKGAYYTKPAVWNIIHAFQPGELPPGKYVISLWMYIPDLKHSSKYTENVVLETNKWEYISLPEIDIFEKKWVRMSRTFEIPQNFKGKVTIFIWKEDTLKKQVILDNFLIYKKHYK